MVKKQANTVEELLQKIDELEFRLSESEEALSAIRNGEVDAIIVSGSDGEKVFSLATAETPYRILLEEMDEGAMTINSECNVLYCNQKFADLLSRPISQIIGSNCNDFISESENEKFRKLVNETHKSQTTGLFSFTNKINASLRYLQFSFRSLPAGITGEISIIASDVTDMKKYQEHLEEVVKDRTLEINNINEQLRNDLIKLEKARVSLSESEQKYRTTLNSIGDAVIATDLNGFVIYMNPLAEQITGWVFIEAKNKPVGEIFNVIDEETRDKIDNPVVEALQKGVIYVGLTNHTLLIRKDGSEIVIADSAAVIKDKNGDSSGVVLVFRDMTQKRLSEKLLRESERKYQALFNNKTVGLSYCQTIFDNNGTPVDYIVLDINSTYELLVGITRKQIVGKWITEVFPGLSQDLIDKHNRVALTGEEIHFEIYEPTIDMWFDINVFSPLKGYFITIFYNITSRKKAEEALKESKLKLDLAIENANIGLWEWNLKTDEMFWDERMEKMFDIQPDSFERNYKSFEKLINEEDVSHVQKAILDAIERDWPYETLFRTRLENGKTKYISSKALVNKDNSGEAISSPVFVLMLHH